MSWNELKQIANGMALETALWFAVATAFLGTYVLHFAGPPQAIVPHLSFLGTLIFALWCTRFAVWRLLAPGKAAHLVSAIITAAFLFLLVAYYATVLIGLQSWGSVITWPLMRTCSLHLDDLLRPLEVSPTLIACASALVFVTLVAIVILMPRRQHWTRQLARASRAAPHCSSWDLA